MGAAHVDERVSVAVVALFLVMSWKLNRERESGIVENSRLMEKVAHVGNSLEPNSTFAGFVFEDNLVILHTVDIAAAENHCLMLNNYEQSSSFFPVRKPAFAYSLDTLTGSWEGTDYIPAKYVMIIGDYRAAPDTVFSAEVNRSILERYELVEEDAPVRLYRQR